MTTGQLPPGVIAAGFSADGAGGKSIGGPVDGASSAPARALGTAYDGYAREYTQLLVGHRSAHLAETVGMVRRLLGAGGEGESGHPGPLNRLVDLACGPGLVSAELAADGWNVTGVDASGELVHLARQRLPRVLHADATATQLPPGADAVVSTYSTRTSPSGRPWSRRRAGSCVRAGRWCTPARTRRSSGRTSAGSRRPGGPRGSPPVTTTIRPYVTGLRA
jgi:hypothetical protein